MSFNCELKTNIALEQLNTFGNTAAASHLKFNFHIYTLLHTILILSRLEIVLQLLKVNTER